MPRKIKQRKEKPVIFVFYEGESEEAYIKFLKQKFIDKVNIYIHNEKGLFNTALNAFKGNKTYSSVKSEINEIWFIFDTEIEKSNKWDEVIKYISPMKKYNKTIQIRLLMTTACIEYFFLLHYKKTAPAIATPADKDRIQKLLNSYISDYKKGNKEKIFKIAERYNVAIENGKWSLKNIEFNLPTLNDCDERNSILFKGNLTFTTVHEALEYLNKL